MTQGPAGSPRGPADRVIRFGEQMTGVEALMWRLERHAPRFRATMSLVVRLDRPVTKAALSSRLTRLCLAVPRLRERVREARLAMLPPSWEPDPSFSVERHVAERTGPLWEVAAGVVGAPFEEGRPPWRVVLVHPSVGDTPAVVLHLHHSYTDGLGGMRLLAELFDFGPEPRPEPGPDTRSEPSGRPEAPEAEPPPATGGPAGTSWESRLHEIGAEVGRELGRAVDLWSRAVPWASRTIASAGRDPAGLLDSAGAVADALQLHAGAAMAPASPLLGRRSDGVVLAPLEVGVDALRRTAHRVGVTLNDVFLAGLLGGLERYHAKHGSVAPSLRLGLPISSRESDTEMRNQVFGAVLRAPLGSLDFDERALLVHEMVLHARSQPWASLVDEAAAGALRVPGAVRLVAAAMSSLDVLASNVVGPPAPMWLAGVPVSSMTPVGPRSGAALNATLLSYRGSAAIGLNADPAALPDTGLLLDCLSSSFDEACGPEAPSGAPGARRARI